jgi:cyanocobalamin reductase (cyanide-eliminating) / alkylcobalamin dealkylase
MARAHAWKDVVSVVAPAFRAAGFDICHGTRIGVYNSAVRKDLALPGFDAGESTLALIVGNTRALWPKFIDAYRRSEAIRGCPHPLDLAYTVPLVHKVIEELLPQRLERPIASYVRFVHDVRPSHLVAVSQFAHAAGLAFLSPASYLSVHPEFGPWISFRAVIVLDAFGPDDTPLPVAVPEREESVGELLSEALATADGASADWGELSPRSRAFLRVREAYGFEAHRFPSEMILYHYDKDKRVLDRAAGSPPPPQARASACASSD